MKRTLLILLGTVGTLILAVELKSADRDPWTTSRIVGTPEPPPRLTAERVFPSLTFTNPVDMAYLPGTDWLYVLELSGKVHAFDSSQEDPGPHMVFAGKDVYETHNHSYGIAFHPDVARNRYVFLSWTEPGQMVPDGTHVSRFELTSDEPPQIRPETRRDIIRWPSGGHNGACLKFGPDGYLYVSAGDGVGPFPPDSEETGQDVSDLRATIMRIDVDVPEADREYRIPSDNPFIDLQSARPEVWAYGFRNPWKMNFSPDGEDFYAGDVGWELWEMIYRVEKGGNYGWSVMEGRQPIRSDVERGPTPILPPLVDHPHTESRSITGGYVYRGQRLSEISGAYIYGDYETGKIWGLRNDGNQLTWHEELADTSLKIITFGENEQGDLFIIDYGGGLYRLTENPRFGQQSDFPRRLSETGLFVDVAQQVPATGVIPYSLIAEPWMEGAMAERFVALPEQTAIEFQRNRLNWVYPVGTVFVKTILLPDHELSSQRRPLETQLLHFDGNEWHPYTYIWNDDFTDAELAPPEGSQRNIEWQTTDWSWRFHSRAECGTCHTLRAGFTLGFFPENLDLRDINADGTLGGKQLDRLAALGIFNTPVPSRLMQSEIVDPEDSAAELAARARAYLMVNCAHCHRRGGGGTAHLELPFDMPLEKTSTIDALPTQGTFDIPHARIIAGGDPYRSVLYYRMATVGRGHMPHLGARRVDDDGLQLVHDWIASLAPSSNDAATTKVLKQRSVRESAAVELLKAGSDVESQTTDVALSDELLASTTQALRIIHALAAQEFDQSMAQALIDRGSANKNPIVRGLFERFLPESRRSERLGTVVDAAQILILPGVPEQGRELFMTGAGVQCRNCHQIGEQGRSVGPKLDDVGKRLSREQILQSILDPSRRIDGKWVAHTLVTTDGHVLTGLIDARTTAGIDLRDIEGKVHTIGTEQIDELVPQQKSLMPELLVQDFTAEQLADLLAFLASLK